MNECDCIDQENAVLTLWARDLLSILEGKPKGNGVRGGKELESVENKIVFILDGFSQMKDLLYEFQNNPNVELGEVGHEKIEKLLNVLQG